MSANPNFPVDVETKVVPESVRSIVHGLDAACAAIPTFNHDPTLYSLLQEYVPDRLVQKLLWQYLRRTVYCDGFYSDVKRGISLGCPLSPLMGALYLKPLDDMMEKTGLYYARFMDDWIVIAPTRWKLRSAVRIVNATLNALRVEQHPDKTFIGRVERGFDFLGYFLKLGVLRVARGTFVRITRLYEQGAGIERIGEYVKLAHESINRQSGEI